jgi:phosphoadenosine phosphosulfate reductase
MTELLLHRSPSAGATADRNGSASTTKLLNERFGGADLFERLTAARRTIAGPIIFTTSFGLEDQAITHAIFAQGLTIEVVTLDTGRLFAETYAVWAATERRYGIRIRSHFPDRDAVEALIARDGIEGFRTSVAARHDCCAVRKVEPLGRALEGAAGWITGLRVAQSRGDASCGNRSQLSCHQAQPAGRLVPGRRRRLRAGISSPLQRAARPRLPLDRLRAMHARGRAR